MSGIGDQYHAHVKAVSRGSGNSAVGLAAYVTGERLYDEENKRTAFRNHAGEVEHCVTKAPDWAPEYLTNPKQLGRAWNDVQKSETRVNSHLANHDNIGIPHCFDSQAREWVMHRIARAYVDRYQVMVTAALHKPTDHGDDRNWHLHIAHNMRRITPEGFGEKAREITAKATKSFERKWQRQMYADVINEKLAEMGREERVSPLSFEERGIDRTPTKHRGHEDNMLEIQGVKTRIGEENRQIVRENEELAAKDREEARQQAEIIDLELRFIKQGMRHMDDDEPMPVDRIIRQAGETHLAMWTEVQEVHPKQQRENLNTDRLREETVKQAKQAENDKLKREADDKRRAMEGDIHDARNRHQQSLEGFGRGDWIDSAMRAVTREVALMAQQQERRNMDIADAERKGDKDTVRLLQLAQKIEVLEFTASFDKRNAAMSRDIARSDNPRAQLFEERHRVATEEADKFRVERLSFQRQLKARDKDAKEKESGQARDENDPDQKMARWMARSYGAETETIMTERHHREFDTGLNTLGRKIPETREQMIERHTKEHALRETANAYYKEVREEVALTRATGPRHQAEPDKQPERPQPNGERDSMDGAAGHMGQKGAEITGNPVHNRTKGERVAREMTQREEQGKQPTRAEEHEKIVAGQTAEAAKREGIRNDEGTGSQREEKVTRTFGRYAVSLTRDEWKSHDQKESAKEKTQDTGRSRGGGGRSR